MLRTKIVCTLGPASASAETIGALIEAGMDMARVNMSHGSHEEHRTLVERVREGSERAGRPVAVLVDLAGPKIRVGELEEPRELVEGTEVVLAPQETAEGDAIPTTLPELASELDEGDRILLDDGLLELRVVGRDGDRLRADVVRGGSLGSRKGINLPGVALQAPSLTAKDLEDLDFALEMGVDFIGLSFVRRAEDVRALKERVGRRALVVAKIEKAQALDVIDDILLASDAVMVARGDLGVELPFEAVPMAQKRIIRRANELARPVITATQMLESMMDYPRPTRAEASDVANAIIDGTGAVMLSGETAAGRYPVESVRAMARIVGEIERSGTLMAGPRYDLGLGEDRPRGGASLREHAIAGCTVQASRRLDAPAIVVITRSGFSARLVSSYRPPMPIFAVCTDPRTHSQLSAVWGVRPVLSAEEEVSYEGLTEFGRRMVVEQGAGERGETVVVTAGYPFHTAGSTNLMRIEEL